MYCPRALFVVSYAFQVSIKAMIICMPALKRTMLSIFNLWVTADSGIDNYKHSDLPITIWTVSDAGLKSLTTHFVIRIKFNFRGIRVIVTSFANDWVNFKSIALNELVENGGCSPPKTWRRRRRLWFPGRVVSNAKLQTRVCVFAGHSQLK